MIKNLSICGLRGFGVNQTINFAIPNQKPGSGITFIVGSNNSGKTTILEALRAFNHSSSQPPHFSERKRNIKCESKVHLTCTTTNNDFIEIRTTPNGGSPTEFTIYDSNKNIIKEYRNGLNVYILQSRRYTEYEFDHSEMERSDYIQNQIHSSTNRSASLMWFNSRIFRMYKNKSTFDILLKSVLGDDLQWTIEQYDNGRFYLKIISNGCIHSSEGMGDGIWSVFTICDALYDSEAGSTIAIDEPELSLHPAYQKSIMSLLKEYSKDRQIIINTHSPYFIDLESLVNGACLSRTIKNVEGDINIFELTRKSCDKLNGFLTDINQPHTFGTEAKEIFFLEDKIIVTEGQEDVIMYRKASDRIQQPFKGSFFGWGSGGAHKINTILNILHDLGYKKVSTILDNDKKDELEKLSSEYNTYDFHVISKDDVRDKRELCRPSKEGIMTEKGVLKDEHKEEMSKMIESINNYFG